jgi:hypothetical protein
MATYSPNVLKSSGSLGIKFSAWLRHSSSDEMVLPDFRFFLFFGEDAGMGAAASASSQNSLLVSQRLLQGQPENDRTKTSDPKWLFLKYLILNKVSFFSVTINNRRMAEM